jgi:hypothetical protein
VVEPKDNTKSIDETIQRYEQYEQLFPQYFQEEYDKVAQDLGQVKTSEDRNVIRGPFSKEPTYTEQDLETKAVTQAKKRLSDEGILEPKRTFLNTLKETFTDYKKFGSKLPYLGGGVEAYEALDLLQSIKDIQRGTADQADYATVMNAQLEMERDSGFGAMVVDIMIQLPAYAVEFSTTAGTYTTGRKAGQKALQESVNWVLSKQGKKLVKEGADRFGLKAVKGVVGATTGTLARTVDPKMFSRVVANVSRELLPDYELNRKLDGKLEVLSSNEKSLGKSIVDGYLLTYLELLGEQSGEAIPFLGKEFKTFLKSKPESAVHGLLKSLIRKNPDVPPGKFMQGVRQAGIQSVPVELMEERFTDFLQSGVEGHEFKWPTAEEWLAEIVAIGGFSASVRGVGRGLDKKAEKKSQKARAKGLEAIESGQARQLTDQDIRDFVRSLTKEEAMEMGINQETGEIEGQSILGKEMIRRNLEMDKFPETETEFREAGARENIKKQQMEGKDFVGKLIEKAQSESGIAIEREYMDRTLADEIADEELSEERSKEILREHGIDENTDPKEIMITGRTSGFVVRLSTAGTEERMAEEFVAVSEEMAEVYYNAEVENIGEQEFENEIEKDRKNYYESTGEKDTGESNKEWFSTMALRFSTQGKVHESIGAKLTEIFKDLMERAQILLQDAFRLQKHIKEGKVSDSLLKKLEEATDFKKVGEKVQQAKESKKQPTYRVNKETSQESLISPTESQQPSKFIIKRNGRVNLEKFQGKVTPTDLSTQSISKIKKSDWLRADGDVVVGDIIKFKEGVFGGNYRNPKYVGDRSNIAIIIKDSYGEVSGQHTFSIEILKSTGVEKLAKGFKTRRKGRVIYRNGVERLLWNNEQSRELVKDEKHNRGQQVRNLKKERYLGNISYRLTTQESYELHDTAKRIFGTTEDPREAGYILLDGEMLDFSGKNEGGTPGTRAYDHRQINQVGDDTIGGDDRWDNVSGMMEFIQSGAIRYMPESFTFHMGNEKPDQPQLARLRQLIDNPPGMDALHSKTPINITITDIDGMLKFQKNYDRGTAWEEIKRDMLQFYRTGKGPSITQQFHSSYRLSKKSGGDLVWKNTPIVKQPNLLELTKYLTERAKSIADELGVDLTQNTPEAIDIVSNVIAEEIKIETGNKKNALGWYSIKMQNAIELLSQIHPEIMEDPDHNQVFKVALAITSNGTPVEDNLKIAMVAYEHWKDKGVLPSTFKVGGQEGPAMASAFKVYNKHQKEIGTTAFHTFLNTEFTVKEISNMGYKVSGELVDAKVMGAVIFGPKIGAFLSNINGHYQYLTMDRWFMRTIGRIRGDLKPQQDYSDQLKRFRTALRINPSKMKLYEVSKEDLKNDDKVIEVARKVLKKYAKSKFVKKLNRKASFYPKTKLNMASNTLIKRIDEIQDDPKNATDRKYLREIMKFAVEKSDIEGLTMADAQAIIWFPEKRFFSKFGVGSQRGKKETDYETEARQYVKSRLGSVQPIGSSARRSATGVKESTQKPESLGKEKPTYRLAPTFYSKAERVVTEQFPPTMKSQSVENFLKKNQVKPEEIQWLDLETLLRGKQKVTKEELQEWIQANKIEVEDVMKIDEDDKIIFRVGDLEVYRDNKLVDYTREFNPSDPVENLKMVLVEDLEINKWDIMKDPKRELLDYLDQKYQDQNDQLEYALEQKNTDNTLERIAYIQELQSKVKQDDFEFDIQEAKQTPKHSSYQLLGEKEDYRELLLTLPTGESAEPLSGFIVFKNVEDADDFIEIVDSLNGMEEKYISRTDRDNFRRIEFENIPDPLANRILNIAEEMGLESWKTNQDTRRKSKDVFTTGHYDEPNILAHVRFNTRKSPTGERVLFIEELQSDWHTKGREKGYKQPKKMQKLMATLNKNGIYENKESSLKGTFVDKNKNDLYHPNPNVKTTATPKQINLIENYLNEVRKIDGFNKGLIPDAPFKGNGWIELIMKRMLRYASENNFDRIAWTTSNQQIDRWRNELRQNVDQISWQKLVAGKRELTSEERIIGATTRGNPFIVEEMEELQTQDMGKQSVIVNGLKKNESVFNQTIPLEGETTINGQKVTLEGLLGKQMATQIRNSEDRTGVIEGDDLSVGGQGFKVVYDFAIKKILNKMGKKFGAKVDQVEFKLKRVDWYRLGLQPQLNQPSIRVTRKMKESALKGQPTFRASKMTSTDDVLSSPSFKKWFKGSQIKDKDGKPLVVYHGSGYDFKGFYTPSYFTSDSRYAEGIADERVEEMYEEGEDWNPSQIIYPVYLNIKKPKIVEEFDTSYIDVSDISNEDIKNLKSEGYDGIISGETYIAFEPTQIKSIFNKGTFNPHDPRISFRMAPTNLVTPLAKIYQEQKGNKKSYTKENFELDLVRLGYPEETIKTAKDLFGIIRIKQIETDEPTPIEKELQKLQDMHITRSNLKDRIKRAYRLGAVEKEKEIVKLQKIVTNYARKNLPTGLFKKSEVTGLLAKVRDAKRARELATALERIDRVIDKVNKRSALAKWNKSIKKKAKVKKVRGVTEGTVGAEVQEIVYTIRGKKKGTGYMDLSPAEVEEKIEALGVAVKAREDGEPTEEQTIEISLLLTFGAIKHKTPEEINRATEVFDGVVAEGRMQVVEDQEAYKARMKEIGDRILDVITGGVGPQTQTGVQRLGLKKEGLIAEIKKQLSTFDSHNQSLEYIFDKLSRLDKTSKPLESAINNYFMPMIRQARLAEYNGLVEMNTMLRENAERIFKVKDGALTTRLNQNTVDKITIFHLDGYSPETGRASGNETYSELTYNQAYKKWMELQDPTLHKTFEKMGWDVNKTKRQIEDQLPKDMIKWAEWQLYEFYPMYYHRVNKTFRQRFKVNMPFNPVYSPISRKIGARADEGDDTLNKSKSPMGSMTSAGSLKSRVSNQEELTWIDGDTTIMKHITEMEHFIHYTQVMREMRSVFMNRNISKAIQDFHGSGISRTLNKFMDDIARGGVDRSQNLEWMDKLRANFSRSVIGINPVVYLKQLASIPAYIADVPILDWSKEFVKVLNPLEFKRAYRTLSKSKMVQMRYDQGFERDMVLALQNQKPGKLISGTDWVNTFAYAFTKMGDKQAIFFGGWPVYKYHKKKALKKGKSLKDAETIAMRKFEEASLRSQQASNVEDLGDFQRRGSAYKLFTMFMTSPNQYYRMIVGGWRNLRAGRGSRSENLRRIFVGQLVLTTLFQFISNAFKWDDEDQAISILLYPFAGLLFFGQGFEYMIRSAFNKEYPMGPVSILDPIEDIGKGLKKTFDGKEFNNKKVFKILDEYISGLSKIFGIPYSGPKRSIENTIKVLTEESDLSLKDKALKGIGFRMKEEKKKKKKKKKVKIAEPSYVD